MTPEQNKNLILGNLDKYIIDGRGNFVNFDKDYNNKDYIIWKDDVKKYEEVKEILIKENVENREKWKFANSVVVKDKIAETIIKEIKEWELVYNKITGSITHFRHKKNGLKMERGNFSFNWDYRIIGELGYRKGGWKNYEETIKLWDEREKQFQENERWIRENITNYNNQQSQPQNETNKKSDQKNPPTQNNSEPKPENPNTPLSNQEQPTEPTELNNQNNSPSPSKPENNPLPPPSEIQDNYNSDKSKSEVENNPNLTTQQKEQANELLKIVISAELLTKKKQFNSELLTKLITEKKNNSSLYQSLNKEGRIDKVISKLESIQKGQKRNDNKSQQPLSLTTKFSHWWCNNRINFNNRVRNSNFNKKKKKYKKELNCLIN